MVTTVLCIIIGFLAYTTIGSVVLWFHAWKLARLERENYELTEKYFQLTGKWPSLEEQKQFEDDLMKMIDERIYKK